MKNRNWVVYFGIILFLFNALFLILFVVFSVSKAMTTEQLTILAVPYILASFGLFRLKSWGRGLSIAIESIKLASVSIFFLMLPPHDRAFQKLLQESFFLLPNLFKLFCYPEYLLRQLSLYDFSLRLFFNLYLYDLFFLILLLFHKNTKELFTSE